MAENRSIEWVIANTISESTGEDDPNALAGRILVAISKAGYFTMSRATLILLLASDPEESVIRLPFDPIDLFQHPDVRRELIAVVFDDCGLAQPAARKRKG